MDINHHLTLKDLGGRFDRFWELSGQKIQAIEEKYDTSQGSPVFTWKGKYTTRGWTEWTQGFQYGSAILQFDATDTPNSSQGDGNPAIRSTRNGASEPQ